MQRILGLSALGLFLIAGTSFAQEPATGSGPSSAPVVQSMTTGTGTVSNNRRFGRFRGNNSGRFFRRNNTSNTTTQAMADTSTQPATPATTKPATKPETKPTTTQTVTPTTTTTTEPTTTTSNRRFFGREGGLLSRLGSRFGR